MIAHFSAPVQGLDLLLWVLNNFHRSHLHFYNDNGSPVGRSQRQREMKKVGKEGRTAARDHRMVKNSRKQVKIVPRHLPRVSEKGE